MQALHLDSGYGTGWTDKPAFLYGKNRLHKTI